MKNLIETTFRKYLKVCFAGFYLIVCLFCMIPMGVALFPVFILAYTIYEFFLDWSLYSKLFFFAFSVPVLYFTYGLTLILVTPIVNWIFQLNKKIKNFKGNNYSVESIYWFLHNGLTYVVRYTFLEFITPSPFNIFFYKSMGMTIGENVIINTTNISDPCLITLEDNVTIGGGAHLLAHHSVRGKLYMSPLVIKKGSTIGLKASIFGDNSIPEGTLIKPHEVVLPKKYK